MDSAKTNIVKQPRVRWVTAKWLWDRVACTKAYEAFISQFGERAKVRPIDVVQACYRAKQANWAWWLLNRLLREDILRNMPGGHHGRRFDYRYARMISAPKGAKQ